MEIGKFVFLCTVILLAVVLLDAGLILAWRCLRQRRASRRAIPEPSSEPGTAPPEVEARVERDPPIAPRSSTASAQAMRQPSHFGFKSWIHSWKNKVRQGDRRIIHVIAVAICAFVTVLIGYAYTVGMGHSFYIAILLAAVLMDAGLILVWRRLRQWRASRRANLVSSSRFGPKSWVRFLKDEVWSDDRRAMQVITAVACVFVNVSIGYAYAGEVWVEGWQLWTWATCVTATVICLIPADRLPIQRSKSWRWLFALTLVALLLRITFLESVPGGLHVDEVTMADFALRHVFSGPHGTVYPFRTGPYSQPALHQYVIKLSLALLGNSITGLRVPSALVGTLAVLATYAVVAVFQDRRTALLSAIIMTTYHYHVHWSRMGLNNVWDTLWVPSMLAAYAWGWKRRWSGGAVLAGLALGLSQYFYAGSRLGIFLLIDTMFWLWWQERDSKRLAVHTGKLLLTATWHWRRSRLNSLI